MTRVGAGTPSDPREIQVAHVVKDGQPAATLTRTAGGVEFAYTTAYLDSGRRAVATTLPLTEEPVRTVAGAVPAFFANLLPEGRRLTALRRAVKTSADDELSLLLAVGADPVGDVQVLTQPENTAAAVSPAVVKGSFADVDFADLLATQGIGDPSALAGVQDKVSGRMLTVPLAHQGRAHLLKFEVPELPHVVESEAFFLRVARRLRHPVVDAEVVRDRHGRPGLLVTRFDRVPDAQGGGLRRLAVEDGAQVLGIHPADKYAVSMEHLATALAAVCRSRPLALRAILQQVVLAWATGNGDLHAKNLSVVGSADRTVASIYDIPSTVPYGDTTFALSLAGRRENLTAKALRQFGDEIGVPPPAVERVLAEVLAATADVVEQVRDGVVPFDARRRRDLVRVLERRRRDLGA
ncbi:type II toxin-antitoxin system HipA family toxin [Ornithinimicrobium cryptoxanthini]|uniref:HipA domain-containing protein n=1 Tax=Ornithinimicrobium cryptoxanthini TaxID=2934161 RepID=A0ABY4YFX1_9MICO|nr:HipA domain-containing protein [Ornithinimicrobium cryptoxanthini]USQ75670.1 HipA domain-containing protein [Ornithinimicrobium cryptoxanthini]